MASKLTAEGQKDFARLEKVIRDGLETFVQVGEALAEIRERHLYKDVCSTFESYVQIRWGFSRGKAYQQIAAAETAKLLSTNVDTQPSSEFVVRPLTTLPVEQRVEAWEEAKEAAKAEGKKKPTAQHTTAAVKARRAEKRKEAPGLQAGSPTGTDTPPDGVPEVGVPAGAVPLLEDNGRDDASNGSASGRAPNPRNAASDDKEHAALAGESPVPASSVPDLGTPSVREVGRPYALVFREAIGVLPDPAAIDGLKYEDRAWFLKLSSWAIRVAGKCPQEQPLAAVESAA